VVTDRDVRRCRVAVRVHHHAEYGTGLTGATVASLPVEGGGLVTLDDWKQGHIEAQRQVEPRWNELIAADAVVLLQRDAASTDIVLDGNPEHVVVHRSTLVTDEWGSRGATIVISGDTGYAQTEAEKRNTRFELRATEFAGVDASSASSSAFTYRRHHASGTKVRFSAGHGVWTIFSPDVESRSHRDITTANASVVASGRQGRRAAR
jgi:hypothetical protein